MAVRTIDPITTEIIRSAFTAAADEMNATLIRSAYTPMIYEMKDCSVALLDDEHRVLGQSAGLPIFLGNLEICTRLAEETYGREAWRDGRRLDHERLLHDRHAPERHDGVRTDLRRRSAVGFAACRAHWLDVGAKDPGGPMDSTEIFQEGIRLGPLKVVEGGVQRPDITDLLGRNSRFSHPAVGDLGRPDRVRPDRRAAARGDHRQVRDRHDPRARDEIFAQTERLERAAVAALPDGMYRAEGCARQRRRRPGPVLGPPDRRDRGRAR